LLTASAGSHINVIRFLLKRGLLAIIDVALGEFWLVAEASRVVTALGTSQTLAWASTNSIVIAAALTWAAHSSVAVVLLIMSLAYSHFVTAEAALALVLGANLGSAINPLLEGGVRGAHCFACARPLLSGLRAYYPMHKLERQAYRDD
jgi:Na+/Pi-cotransporter